MREEIAKEKRLISKTEINCRKLENGIEKAANNFNELNIRSGRLNDGINETKQDKFNQHDQLSHCKAQNAQNTEQRES